MPSPPRLPAHLTRRAKELAQFGVNDADVYANTALLENRVQDLRRQFEEALSVVLASRNEDRGRKGSYAMPIDVLLLVLEQLPLEDLFTATHVCRTWRSVAVSHPLLWTRMDARATLAFWLDPVRDEDSDLELEDDEDSDEDGGGCGYYAVSNIYLLRKLLPRTQVQPLTLTVDVAEPNAMSPEFLRKLQHFLLLVAPRLSMLKLHTPFTELAEHLFNDNNHWDFPVLRRLVCSSPGAPSGVHIFDPFNFKHMSCPELIHLDLGPRFQLINLNDQPELTYLRTHVRRLEHVLRHLRETPALTRIAFATCIYEFGVIDYSKRTDIFSALNTLQEVSFRTQNHDEYRVDSVLELFQERVRCPRLSLELADGRPGRTFRPILSGRWVDATELVLRSTPHALEITLTDTKRRTMTIRLLLARGTPTQPVDWARVPCLHTLTALRVDASVWSSALRNFPSTPKLADTTLVIDGAEGLASLNELADGVREVPPVPQGSRLTLASDVPVSIARRTASDVRERLGVTCVGLDGVSQGQLPSV